MAQEQRCAIETFQPATVGFAGVVIGRRADLESELSSSKPLSSRLRRHARVFAAQRRCQRCCGNKFHVNNGVRGPDLGGCVLVLQSCRLDCTAPYVMANKRNTLGIRSCNLAPSEEPERRKGTEKRRNSSSFHVCRRRRPVHILLLN